MACPVCGLSSSAHSAGLKVSELKAEITVAVATGSSELTIELSGNTAEEGGRYEHSRQHERNRDERRADLVHGYTRGLRWR